MAPSRECQGPPAAAAAQCPVHGFAHDKCAIASGADPALLAALKEAGYDVHTRVLMIEAAVAAFTLTLEDAAAVLFDGNPRGLDLSRPASVTERRRMMANMAAIHGTGVA